MITEKSYLEAKKLIAEYESEQLNKPVVNSSVNTGGIDKYFEDLELWENSLCCNECGITIFYYSRTISNGEVLCCKHCKTEKIIGKKPNEDKY